ncbi:hypothetical protein tb265_09620 [Gemmatimonadetes bacterium T265]|nr:hypothetical protein tb265_09620 [Gemmatimonadetes bacterium T265]
MVLPPDFSGAPIARRAQGLGRVAPCDARRLRASPDWTLRRCRAPRKSTGRPRGARRHVPLRRLSRPPPRMPHPRARTATLLLVAGGLGARAPHAARGPSPAHAAARASLLAADRAHAARSARSLTTGFPTALDRDVVLLYPNAPVVRGRAAAESLLRALPDAPHRALRWAPALAELAADGLRGYTLGYGTALAGDSATPVRYLAYWRRTPAGAWHVAAWVLARGAAAKAGATPPRLAVPCATPAAGALRPGTPAAAARELRAADSAFSARSARDGAGPAFAAALAPDGLVVGGSPGMTCGPAAAGALLRDLGPGALVWAPTDADAATSGDLGMTVGTATVRDGADASYSKYLTVWRRAAGATAAGAADGAWRVAADAGNAAPRREGR